MAKIEVAESIQAPLDRVFQLFADFRHTADHVDAIKQCDVLTDGPIGVGTRFRETRIMFGREATEEMQITQFVTNEQYRVEAHSHGAHFISDFTFVPGDDATVVTMTFEVRAVSFMAKLFSFMQRPMLKAVSKTCHQDMLDLKKVLES